MTVDRMTLFVWEGIQRKLALYALQRDLLDPTERRILTNRYVSELAWKKCGFPGCKSNEKVRYVASTALKRVLVHAPLEVLREFVFGTEFHDGSGRLAERFFCSLPVPMKAVLARRTGLRKQQVKDSADWLMHSLTPAFDAELVEALRQKLTESMH